MEGLPYVAICDTSEFALAPLLAVQSIQIRLTHQNTPRDVCSDTLPKRLDTFFSSGSYKCFEYVGIHEPLSQGFGPICTHADEHDFSWVADYSSQTTRRTSTDDVGEDR